MAIAQVVAGARILISDLNAYYSLLKGSAGEAVTLIYNAAGSLIFQPSSDPATGTELIQIKNNAGTVQLALSSDGKVYAADGTAPLPGLTWEQDKDTGVYRVSANVLGFSAGGTEKARLDSSGLSLDGGSTYLSSTSAGGSDTTALRTWFWATSMTIRSTVTGTGAYTAATSGGFATFSCGATSGSTVGVDVTLQIFGAGNSGTKEVRWWSFTFATDKAASEAWRLFLTDESGTAQPSLTAKHLGIRFDGTTANFSTADGTTEQTTAITSSLTANTDCHAVITFDGTTAKLYLDGVLAATHATNVPTAAVAIAPTFRAYITNSTAADKLFYLTQMHARIVS